MAGPEDILVRIAVSGQGDVISAFGSIGQAGESAFARLEDSLGTFGKVAGGLVASITGIGVGLFTLAESSANSTRELRNLATASGISVENLSGMQGALASMGLNTDTLGMSFRRLSMTIEREWD